MRFLRPSEARRETTLAFKRLAKTGSLEPKVRSNNLVDLTDAELVEMLDTATKKETKKIITELARRITK